MPPAISLDPSREERGGLICLSHLRWNFVYQRPQHLLSRAAALVDVFVFEEPIFDATEPTLVASDGGPGVQVLVPHLPPSDNVEVIEAQQRELLNEFIDSKSFPELILWYYTPMALGFTSHLRPDLCVYDCMDELTAFRFAPPRLVEREIELLASCDVVFTGGQSLYDAKQDRHPHVHCCPSSIDKAHFAQARQLRGDSEPLDQAGIPPRRAGFFGVIDERMDMTLLQTMAAQAPDVQFVMIGPLAKIERSELPDLPNLHWLGPKQYRELPFYLAGWDCGIMPFARNESTRFISPTKTPEYLAGGLPVVSTDINDVRRPYGELGLVAIADTAEAFLHEVRRSIETRGDAHRLKRVDQFLSDKSWDFTFGKMVQVMRQRGASLGANPRVATDRIERV
ncbi:Glycosyltransferase [Bradyrhizobium sp. ORS 375]|uniref:glycosyltransferase n=1 Tax=Bradyrhizobium sp. (strain ORS 375) TaxID=566679 RepID=UPI0002406302|nr:glycosyltransferase [Bradyrhizobium sp. ORS 375]CCD91846.1 Glycosyltransferase [Bradyrhizobium sp. ORS 375]